jgi:hypothetical protein
MTLDYSLRVPADRLMVFTPFAALFHVLPHCAGVTSLFRLLPLSDHPPLTALVFIHSIICNYGSG